MSDIDATATQSGALAQAALQEAQRRRRGVEAAMDHLERAVAAPSTDRETEWAERVGEQLRQLQSAFDHHVSATEEPDGLFDEILAEAPRLSHGVAQLRADHVKIGEAIGAAVALASRPDAAGRCGELSELSTDLLMRLTRHRHAGASVVYEAYTVDIDAAD